MLKQRNNLFHDKARRGNEIVKQNYETVANQMVDQRSLHQQWKTVHTLVNKRPKEIQLIDTEGYEIIDEDKIANQIAQKE